MRRWLEEELFYFLLLDNFRPRTRAIAAIPEGLRTGESTAHQAIGEILLSTGFSLRNPGNDTFVTVVLEQCLGLAVQERRHKATLEAGKRMYDGEKARLLTRHDTRRTPGKVVQRCFARRVGSERTVALA